MVEIKVMGRLGNRMFQFAFGYAVSRMLGTRLIFEDQMLGKYFKLCPFDSNFTLRQKITRDILRIIGKWKDFEQYDKFTPPAVILENIKNYATYTSYFQSDLFFLKFKDDIFEVFDMLQPHKDAFAEKYGTLFDSKKIIAVHLRRTDYLEWKTLADQDMSLPMSYYWECFDKIEDFDKYQVLFVSDDIDYARSEFGALNNASFENNSEIIDFQIIQNADIAIIANSSFSWWAAYLDRRHGKKIYMPKYWFGFKIKKEIPVAISPQGWEQIDVFS